MTSLLLALLPGQLFLAQTEQYPSGGVSPVGVIVGFLVAVIVIAAMWKQADPDLPALAEVRAGAAAAR